jgi:putative component of toxin-antitoxin plasmid stabilization module
MAESVLLSYVDAHGRIPFEDWILDLDRQAQAKVAIALSRLQRGNMSNVAAVGEGVWELKLEGPMGGLQGAQERQTTMIEC